MQSSIENLLNAYRVSDAESLLRTQVINACHESRAQNAIEELHNWINQSDSRYFGKNSFYYVLLSIAFLEIEKFAEAENQIGQAAIGFSSQGDDWNASLSFWINGLINNKNEQSEKALGNYQEAQTRLKQHIRLNKNDYIKDSSLLLDELEKIITSTLDTAVTQPFNAVKEPVERAQQKDDARAGTLLLSWLPVLQVQAGQNGPIWFISPEEDIRTEIDEVILDNIHCKIYSAFRDRRQLSFIRNRTYGWAKVQGLSMNKATPTAIEPGDFVLFYSSDGNGEENSIVIAAKSDFHSGDSYLIKRYKKGKMLLFSESTESGKEYDPVPLNDDYRIIGIVIAIAKPS